jgi:hypothetical protein
MPDIPLVVSDLAVRVKPSAVGELDVEAVLEAARDRFTFARGVRQTWRRRSQPARAADVATAPRDDVSAETSLSRSR